MPRSMMSEASSGGVRSSVSLTASMICESGSSSAPRISSLVEHDRLRQAGDHVAAADLGLDLLLHRVGRADLELDLLGRLLADQQLVLALDVVDDRLVELVAADADRLRDDDPAERDDRDLAGAAADVDDHRAGRLADRQAGADRRRHRLLDQVGLARARATGTPPRPRASRRPVTPEGTQTTTRGCAQRFWCTFWMKWRSISSVTSKSAITPSFSGRIAEIVPGRAAEHPLGLDPDGVHLAGARVDRDDARLGQHDAAAAHVDERVGGAEVDRHVAAAEPGQVAEEAHRDEREASDRSRAPWDAHAAACRSAPECSGRHRRASLHRARQWREVRCKARTSGGHVQSPGSSSSSVATGSPTTLR